MSQPFNFPDYDPRSSLLNQTRQSSPTTPSTWQVMKTSMREEFIRSPFPSLIRGIDQHLQNTRYSGSFFGSTGHASRIQDPTQLPMHYLEDEERDDDEFMLLSPDQANEEFGIDGQLSFDKQVTRAYARALYDLKIEELRREDIFSRASGWDMAAGFLASFAVTALDPINVGSAFVPVVGQVRHARWVAKHGRLGARLRTGAIEGGVGAALVEPIILAQAVNEQANYGSVDSFINLAFGSILGGGLHTAGGIVADAVRGYRFKSHEAAFRKAIEQFAEGKHVDVGQILTGGKDSSGNVPDASFDDAVPEYIRRLKLLGEVAKKQYLPMTSQEIDDAVQKAILLYHLKAESGVEVPKPLGVLKGAMDDAVSFFKGVIDDAVQKAEISRRERIRNTSFSEIEPGGAVQKPTISEIIKKHLEEAESGVEVPTPESSPYPDLPIQEQKIAGYLEGLTGTSIASKDFDKLLNENNPNFSDINVAESLALLGLKYKLGVKKPTQAEAKKIKAFIKYHHIFGNQIYSKYVNMHFKDIQADLAEGKFDFSDINAIALSRLSNEDAKKFALTKEEAAGLSKKAIKAMNLIEDITGQKIKDPDFKVKELAYADTHNAPSLAYHDAQALIGLQLQLGLIEEPSFRHALFLMYKNEQEALAPHIDTVKPIIEQDLPYLSKYDKTPTIMALVDKKSLDYLVPELKEIYKKLKEGAYDFEEHYEFAWDMKKDAYTQDNTELKVRKKLLDSLTQGDHSLTKGEANSLTHQQVFALNEIQNKVGFRIKDPKFNEHYSSIDLNYHERGALIGLKIHLGLLRKPKIHDAWYMLFDDDKEALAPYLGQIEAGKGANVTGLFELPKDLEFEAAKLKAILEALQNEEVKFDNSYDEVYFAASDKLLDEENAKDGIEEVSSPEATDSALDPYDLAVKKQQEEAKKKQETEETKQSNVVVDFGKYKKDLPDDQDSDVGDAETSSLLSALEIIEHGDFSFKDSSTPKELMDSLTHQVVSWSLDELKAISTLNFKVGSTFGTKDFRKKYLQANLNYTQRLALMGLMIKSGHKPDSNDAIFMMDDENIEMIQAFINDKTNKNIVLFEDNIDEFFKNPEILDERDFERFKEIARLTEEMLEKLKNGTFNPKSAIQDLASTYPDSSSHQLNLNHLGLFVLNHLEKMSGMIADQPGFFNNLTYNHNLKPSIMASAKAVQIELGHIKPSIKDVIAIKNYMSEYIPESAPTSSDKDILESLLNRTFDFNPIYRKAITKIFEDDTLNTAQTSFKGYDLTTEELNTLSAPQKSALNIIEHITGQKIKDPAFRESYMWASLNYMERISLIGLQMHLGLLKKPNIGHALYMMQNHQQEELFPWLSELNDSIRSGTEFNPPGLQNPIVKAYASDLKEILKALQNGSYQFRDAYRIVSEDYENRPINDYGSNGDVSSPSDFSPPIILSEDVNKLNAGDLSKNSNISSFSGLSEWAEAKNIPIYEQNAVIKSNISDDTFILNGIIYENSEFIKLTKELAWKAYHDMGGVSDDVAKDLEKYKEEALEMAGGPFVSYGLILFDKTGRILTINSKNGFSKNILPKGQADSGETASETMMREVFEETGILGTIDFASKPIQDSSQVQLYGIGKIMAGHPSLMDAGETESIEFMHPKDAINKLKANGKHAVADHVEKISDWHADRYNQTIVNDSPKPKKKYRGKSDFEADLSFVDDAFANIIPWNRWDNPLQVSQLTEFESGAPVANLKDGGEYIDELYDQRWYVKAPKNKNHALNEHVASVFYHHLGVNSAKTRLVVEFNESLGKNELVGIASQWIDGLTHVSTDLNGRKQLKENLTEAEYKIFLNTFAIHAWLGNYDVVGMGIGNIGIKDGKAYFYDPGGSLIYRAQGEYKSTKGFTDTVDALKSLRDPKINPSSAEVFKDVTDDNIKAGVARILALSDDDIYRLVYESGLIGEEFDNTDIASILIARKTNLANEYPALATPLLGQKNIISFFTKEDGWAFNREQSLELNKKLDRRAKKALADHQHSSTVSRILRKAKIAGNIDDPANIEKLDNPKVLGINELKSVIEAIKGLDSAMLKSKNTIQVRRGISSFSRFEAALDWAPGQSIKNVRGKMFREYGYMPTGSSTKAGFSDEITLRLDITPGVPYTFVNAAYDSEFGHRFAEESEILIGRDTVLYFTGGYYKKNGKPVLFAKVLGPNADPKNRVEEPFWQDPDSIPGPDEADISIANSTKPANALDEFDEFNDLEELENQAEELLNAIEERARTEDYDPTPITKEIYELFDEGLGKIKNTEENISAIVRGMKTALDCIKRKL